MTLREMQTVLDDFKYKDWKFILDSAPFGVRIILEYRENCNFTGRPTQIIRSEIMDSYSSDHFLDYLKHIILDAERHEALEKMRYKGEMIFNPHNSTQNHTL